MGHINFVFSVTVGLNVEIAFRVLWFKFVLAKFTVASITVVQPAPIPVLDFTMTTDDNGALLCNIEMKRYTAATSESDRTYATGYVAVGTTDITGQTVQARSDCPGVDNSKNWAAPAGSSRNRRRRAMTADASPTGQIFTPVGGDSWVGTCDAELFMYTARLQYISMSQYLLAMTVYDTTAAQTCTMRSLYRVRGSSGQNLLYLVRRPDTDFDLNQCWMQTPPLTLSVSVGYLGVVPNLWVYQNNTACPRINLRPGTSVSEMQEGDVMSVHETMASSTAQLVVGEDGNLILYSWSLDIVLWQSNTSVPTVNPTTGQSLQVSFSLTNGRVTLRHSYDSFQTTTLVRVLNPAGPFNGTLLVVNECDVQLYAGSTLGKALWSLIGRPCPDKLMNVIQPSSFYPTGGNILLQGNTLREQNGLYNNNGVFLHEYGEAYFLPWSTRVKSWGTLSNSSIQQQQQPKSRTIALSLLWSGDLVLMDYNGVVVWSSGTAGSGATVLRLEKCSLALYRSGGMNAANKVWSLTSSTGDTCNGVPDTPQYTSSGFSSFPVPKGRIEPGQFLQPGQSLISGAAQLIHLPNGNVVLYTLDNRTMPRMLWSSSTAGIHTTALAFEFDGTFALYKTYDPTQSQQSLVAWSAQIVSRPQMVVLGDDCTLKMYDNLAPPYRGSFIPSTATVTISATTCPGGTNSVTTFAEYNSFWWVELGYPLYRGQSVGSASGNSVLLIQPDGDVVFFATNGQNIVPNTVSILWRSGTVGNCTSSFGVELGNVFLRDCAGRTIWSLFSASAANTFAASGAYYLTVLDGTFQLQATDGTVLWDALSVGFLTQTLPPARPSTQIPNNAVNSVGATNAPVPADFGGVLAGAVVASILGTAIVMVLAYIVFIRPRNNSCEKGAETNGKVWRPRSQYKEAEMVVLAKSPPTQINPLSTVSGPTQDKSLPAHVGEATPKTVDTKVEGGVF